MFSAILISDTQSSSVPSMYYLIKKLFVTLTFLRKWYIIVTNTKPSLIVIPYISHFNFT